MIAQVVSEVADNTDVQLGFENGQIQVAVVPRGEEDDTCVDNSQDSGTTGIRNGPNVATGDCDCWERGFDYVGADLPISNNPSNEKNAQECQKSCQNTQGCSHWSFKRPRGRRRRRRETQCWRKSSGFSRQERRGQISGKARCGPQPSVPTPVPR
jgi:hypothetical protein